MANIQHHYKSFPLFGSVSAAEDMTCKQTVWTFNDVSNNSPNYRLSISHIMRDGGVDDGESDYYGHNARLNLSERLLEENGTLYYVDPIGDKYEVNSNYVDIKGLRLTTATPAWVSAKTLFASLNPGNLRWLIDVTNENIVKGFNSAGYLVFMSDEARKLFYIKRYSDNRIDSIQDVNKDEARKLYSFKYYDSKLLEKITDHLNGRNVDYTYSGKKLYTIFQMSGAKYTLGHNVSGTLFRVDSSDGYSVTHSLNMTPSPLTVQSTLTGIPGEEALFWEDIAKWTVSYSGDTCTITDIDGNKEYYKISMLSISVIYAKEVHGVITEAYRTFGLPYTGLITAHVKNEYLYVPYSTLMNNFEDKLGETEAIDYFNGKLKSRKIIGRRISVDNSNDYSTADITTNYYYDPNNPSQCTSENTTVTLNLYNGTTKTFTPVKTHEYNDQGLLKKTTSYIGNDYKQEREKEYQEFTYTFNEDGSYKKCTSKYRGSSSVRFRTEENYDKLGRKMSEKDPAGNFYYDYYYYGDKDLLESIENSTYYRRDYVYDYHDNLQYVYSTVGNKVTSNNEIAYDYDEATCLKGNDQIDITYNAKRDIKSIAIAGNSGSKIFDYSEDDEKKTVTATNENGDVIKCESAKDGSYEKVYYNGALQLTYNYNYKGQLWTIEDHSSNRIFYHGYNALEQMTGYTEMLNNEIVETHDYRFDEYGNLLQENWTGQVSRLCTYTYEDLSDRRFKGMSFSGVKEEVTYDNLDRLETKKVTYNGAEVYTKTYDYRDVKQGAYTNATNQPKNIKFTKGGQTKQQVGYNYQDATGLLSEVNVNGKNINYYYENNNLLREDNRLLNVSQGRSYYGNGNISTYTKGAYQTNNGGAVSGTTTSYTYSGDRMMSYGNQACEYDNMGNPTTYRGKSATWKGRQMLSFDGNNFTYDGIGRRTSKNSLTFLYDDKGNILKQSNDLEFFYDFEGVTSVRHKKQMYFYLRDGQGNIIAIVDSTGSVVVQYYYDAWGNHKVVDEKGDEITDQDDIGNLNPFRYRGYYYDTETGLYFLQTRYYDPEVGRFLNRDSVEYADPETINGLNLYAYCLNNPVEYVDPEGTWGWSSFWRGVANVLTGIGAIVAGALVIASGVAGVGMLVVAGVTVTAGVLTTVNGGADIGEAISGYNFVRDGIFGSNQSAYDLYSGITAGVAAIGSAICGGWLRYNAPRINAYKNIEAYQYSNTLMDSEHMARSYQQSVLLQKQIIKYGKMVKESKQIVKFSIRGGFMIGTGAWHNATWKLVVNYIEGIILHIGPF